MAAVIHFLPHTLRLHFQRRNFCANAMDGRREYRLTRPLLLSPIHAWNPSSTILTMLLAAPLWVLSAATFSLNRTKVGKLRPKPGPACTACSSVAVGSWSLADASSDMTSNSADRGRGR